MMHAVGAAPASPVRVTNVPRSNADVVIRESVRMLMLETDASLCASVAKLNPLTFKGEALPAASCGLIADMLTSPPPDISMSAGVTCCLGEFLTIHEIV